MRKIPLVVLGLLLGLAPAHAADRASGSGGLALAALVGLHAPSVTAARKHVLAQMLEGDLSFSSGGIITVTAASVTCRSSNVDISAHDCTLKFSGTAPTLKGRAAHELYATLVENGVAPDGAAGSNFEAVSNLSCTIDVTQVKQRGGGGADCTYQAGPGS